jgi:hypothetical protein
MNKKLSIIIVLITALALSCQKRQKPINPNLNVIYGDHHIFTVETPEGWINDKDTAATVNLVSLFYAQEDSNKNMKSYIYAIGYDKGSKDDNLTSFVQADLEKFREKYPEFKFEKILVKPIGGILNAEMYSFDNLRDRYKEEVLYMETDSSILVLSFATITENDYKKYQPVFDKFVASLIYRGNDPGAFMNWEKSRK